jgi:hypothetical protein
MLVVASNKYCYLSRAIPVEYVLNSIGISVKHNTICYTLFNVMLRQHVSTLSMGHHQAV